MPDLSIVIVSWNAKEYMRKCLSSLRTACTGLSTEIFVVDNASSDGTPDAVEQEFPEVRLIRNTVNAGFATANNIGMRMATGKYVALINSDVEVLAGCLQKMVSYLEQHPSVGMLGPKMLTPSGSAAPSCMRRPRLSIWLTHAVGLASLLPTLSLQIQNPDSLGTRDVDVLNGWFWMVRKEALDQVGLLDERFFMYGEDIDWCHRFWERGWKLVYFPEAKALHYGAASSARAPVRFYVEMQRANLQYWKRYHGRISQAVYIVIIFLHQVCRVLGYGAVCLVTPDARHEAAFKCQRSAACLRWLMGFDHRNMAQAR
jgi:GT2 family glycosyltransferase